MLADKIQGSIIGLIQGFHLYRNTANMIHVHFEGLSGVGGTRKEREIYRRGEGEWKQLDVDCREVVTRFV